MKTRLLLRRFLRPVLFLLPGAVLVLPVAQAKSSPKTPPALSASWSGDLKPVWAHVYNLKTSPALPQRLAGDGTTDDLPALRADFAWLAAHGGGVLYAPAGTYHLDNIGPGNVIRMEGAAVLEGDGIDKTVFHYTGVPNGLVQLLRPNVCGFVQLSLICDAPDEQPPYSAALLHPAAGTFGNGAARDVFFKFVNWDVGSGRGIAISGVTNMDVEDSKFLSLRGNHGTISIRDCANLLVTRNLFHYKGSRIFCMGVSGLTFTHNRLIRAGGIHTPRIESGGLDCSYSQHALIAYNYFTVDGPCDMANNDGESILTQNDGGAGGAKRFTDSGTLTAAGAATLTDTAKAWDPAPWPATTMAAITSGAGLGQVRPVVSHDASSVTVSPAWKTRPSPGDQYTLLSFPAKDMVIKNNVLKNNPVGISMYSGSYRVAITGNTLTNSEGILISAQDLPGRHQPAWDNIIAHNKVTNSNGQSFSTVGLLVYQNLPRMHGNLTHGNIVIKNDLGKHPLGTASVVRKRDGVQGDGIYLKVVHHPELTDVIKDNVPNVTNGHEPSGR